MKEAVLTLDIGTSSVRAGLFDVQGRPTPGTMTQRRHAPTVAEDGTSTLDPERLVDSAVECLAGAIDGRGIEVVMVGMATFWHSVLGVDSTGQACTPIFLWNDTRAARQVEALRRSMDERSVRHRTGCVFHTSYLPARLLWLREADPCAFNRAACWMSPGEYLFLRLFGERECSLSMASATGLLNQETCRWDEETLARVGVAETQLSPIVDIDRPAPELRAEYKARLEVLNDVPWLPALGDGACSSVGSGGIGPNRITAMVGTSGAMRILGSLPVGPPPGLWRYCLDRRRSLIGGAISNGGAVFQWLLGALQLPDIGAIERYLDATQPDTHGLTVLPFLNGERSPDWLPNATGAILGMTAATTPLQILQASLEAICYRFMLVHDLLEPLAKPDAILVGTGAALGQSRSWAHMLCDALGREMAVLADVEGTSRGLALLCLEQLGLIRDITEFSPAERERLHPRPHRQVAYRAGLERHTSAVRRLYPEQLAGG